MCCNASARAHGARDSCATHDSVDLPATVHPTHLPTPSPTNPTSRVPNMAVCVYPAPRRPQQPTCVRASENAAAAANEMRRGILLFGCAERERERVYGTRELLCQRGVHQAVPLNDGQPAEC